jgi:hypothetical protein
MTITDWVIDIALILIVFRQLREARLTPRTVLLPLAIMAWAGYNYLHGIPTAGNDVKLIAIFTAVGVAFGLISGLLTRVRRRDGNVYIKATVGAAAVWVVSMGFRLAFGIWASHPSGAAHIASFSVAHDITSSEAWVVSLLCMAFAEVIVRMGTIVIKGQTVSSVSASQESLTAM